MTTDDPQMQAKMIQMNAQLEAIETDYYKGCVEADSYLTPVPRIILQIQEYCAENPTSRMIAADVSETRAFAVDVAKLECATVLVHKMLDIMLGELEQAKLFTDGTVMYNPILQVFVAFASMINQDSKRRTLCIYGATNTGKTTLIDMLHLILKQIAQKYNQTSAKFDSEIKRSRVHAAVVTIDELNSFEFFAKARLAAVKMFFEGNGLCVEHKGKDPYMTFYKSFVLLSYNNHPRILDDRPEETPTDCHERYALRGRMHIIRFNHSYTTKNNIDKFPLSTEEVALLLNVSLSLNSQEKSLLDLVDTSIPKYHVAWKILQLNDISIVNRNTYKDYFPDS